MLTPRSVQYTGTGSAVTLASICASLGINQAHWIQFAAPSTNSSPVLIGGPEVLAVPGTKGFPLQKGSGMFYPSIGSERFGNLYDFTLIYVYVAMSDVLDLLFGG